MARTSKRKVRMDSGEDKQLISDKVYSVGIYARLSVDNHDGKETSIDSQIAMGKEYIKDQLDLKLYDCYSDLGMTGTNFERQGFERLMQDIRDGYVNCVIVKDFSRFGRNYIETGNYIEKIFPFMGVRFIAITDYFDSARPADHNQRLSMNLKNIVNELYAKDIAQKVTASKMMKMQQGDFIGSNAPYGYIVKRIEGKRVLFPELGTSEVVKKIFELYDAGETLVSIISWLYEHRIHRPGDYRKYKTVYWEEGQRLVQWDRGSLKTILTNASYLGNLTQSSKGADRPITVEHTHEPLIDAEVYYRAWSRMEKNIQIQKCRPLKKETLEVLYCGECGHKLVRMISEKKHSYHGIRTFVFYGCPNRKRIDDKKCDTEHITFLSLRKMILKTLKKEFAFGNAQMKKLTAFNMEQSRNRKIQLQQKESEIQKRMENDSLQASSCYLAYKSGKISQEMFQIKKEELEKQKQHDGEELLKLQKERNSIDKEAERQNCFIRSVVKCEDAADLNAQIVSSLISRINVYSGKRVEIIWNFNIECAYEEAAKQLSNVCAAPVFTVQRGKGNGK